MALTGLRALDAVPALLFLLVVLVIGLHADQFLTVDSFRQILQQSAPIVVVATGMTFVLLDRRRRPLGGRHHVRRRGRWRDSSRWLASHSSRAPC